MEKMPTIAESLESKKRKLKEAIIMHAEELSELKESLPFTGIDPEVYEALKKGEEEFPGYTAPIDELIERFKTEGIKVVLGDDPKSGNVTLVPWGSTDYNYDSILPRNLDLTKGEDMDDRLMSLVSSSKEYKKLV